MDAWRASLASHIEAMREDDEETERIFNNYMDQVCDNVHVEPKVQMRGSRPG